MNKLARGGMILALLSMCVIFIYAQVETDNAVVIAKDLESNSVNNDNNLKQEIIETNNNDRLVEEIKSIKSETEEAAEAEAEAPAAAERSSGTAKGTFVATAYCLRGKTAMGHQVRKGLIAADPRVLRLGSRVKIGAGAHSGNYLVSDTGGKIKGKKIDIWMASCSEARRFGRRNVTIHLLK